MAEGEKTTSLSGRANQDDFVRVGVGREGRAVAVRVGRNRGIFSSTESCGEAKVVGGVGGR